MTRPMVAAVTTLLEKAEQSTCRNPAHAMQADRLLNQLADGLLSIYRDAKRISNDGRMLAS